MIAVKDPGDTVDYTVEFAEVTEATITEASVSSSPAGLTVVGSVVIHNDSSPRAVTFWLSGGAHSQTYSVEVAATLSTGVTLNRNITVRCSNG